MTKTFTVDEMNSTGEDQAKLAQLKDRVEGSCKGKLPEDAIKASFLQGCTSEDPTRKGYCECTWVEYRKTFSAAELTDDATAKSERFATAKKTAVKACVAKLPEDVVRNGFLKGCMSTDAMKPFCACAWKTIRTMGSAGDIEAGLVDQDQARAKIGKACAALRPK
jgi:hypothetical protein